MESYMSAITIKDLPLDVELDRSAMASIRGGDGAPWVFGAFQPFIEASSRIPGSVINLFQTNTFYTADQMTNQFLSIDVKNSAPGSNISVMPTVVGVTQR
jgi:hypothetical protein